MKTVYGWVVDWGDKKYPRLSVDLFFSSKEKFNELLGYSNEEQLVPVEVAEDFCDIDYIPDNY